MSKPLAALLFGTWVLIILTQTLSMVPGITNLDTVRSVVSVVVAAAGVIAIVVLVLKQRSKDE